MPTRRRTPVPLPLQIAELSLAVPQVVAHRVARMATAGPLPSARDRKEFHRMSDEKAAAFSESWSAMWWQGALAQQRFAMACMDTAFVGSNTARQAALSSAAQQLATAGLGVLGHGMAPVHRRAVANAKRLSKLR